MPDEQWEVITMKSGNGVGHINALVKLRKLTNLHLQLIFHLQYAVTITVVSSHFPLSSRDNQTQKLYHQRWFVNCGFALIVIDCNVHKQTAKWFTKLKVEMRNVPAAILSLMHFISECENIFLLPRDWKKNCRKFCQEKHKQKIRIFFLVDEKVKEKKAINRENEKSEKIKF